MRIVEEDDASYARYSPRLESMRSNGTAKNEGGKRLPRWLQAAASGKSLFGSLRDDRFLLFATITASGAVLLPLFLTPFLPLQDLPNHVALASLLSHMREGGDVSTYHFMPQPYPVPYWVGYMIIVFGAKLASPLLGAKLFVAAALLAVPLGLIRLLPSLGRSPRLGLWAFALSWDYNLSWGFVAFNLATGLSFAYIAWAIDSLEMERWRWEQPAKALGFGSVLALTHAHATGVAVLALGALALSALPNRREATRLMQFSVAPLLGLLPWLSMGFLSGDGAPMPDRLSGLAHSPNAGERVRHLFDYTLGFSRGHVSESMMGIAFVILLVVPLLLLASSKPTGPKWRRALVLYTFAWTIYLVLPASLNWPFGQLFIQQRHATLILLMGLTLPSCELGGRCAWRLAPGLIAIVLCVGVNARLASSFAKHSEPFLEIIDAVPEESRVLPVLMETAVPGSRRTPLNQFPAYIVAVKGGYIPYLFDTPNLVVRYQPTRHLPHMPWWEPKQLSLEEHASHYDYLLVQGKKKDPTPGKRKHQGSVDLVEVKEAGIWRLYRVQHGSK